MERQDLNEIRQVLQEAQYLREALRLEREASDRLTAARAAHDASRDTETALLKSALTAAQRQIRSDKAPHLIAFAEAYKDNEYDRDYRIGVRLEWKLF